MHAIDPRGLFYQTAITSQLAYLFVRVPCAISKAALLGISQLAQNWPAPPNVGATQFLNTLSRCDALILPCAAVLGSLDLNQPIERAVGLGVSCAAVSIFTLAGARVGGNEGAAIGCAAGAAMQLGAEIGVRITEKVVKVARNFGLFGYFKRGYLGVGAIAAISLASGEFLKRFPELPESDLHRLSLFAGAAAGISRVALALKEVNFLGMFR